VRSVERAVSVLESEMRHIDQRLLKEPAENRLFDTAYRLLPEIAHRATEYDFAGLYHALGPLREPVDQFFDDVMVMVEDAVLRRNRLALLRLVDALYKTMADFTKVVIA
jgi:glycyl-tRNA synthetase beta chain